MITVQIQLNVPWLPLERKPMALEEGCTVKEMLEGLGFEKEQTGHVMVVINGKNRLLEDRVGDGDSVMVLPVLYGG